MAKQLPDLNEMLANFATGDDLFLVRDTSLREDKKIKLSDLADLLFLMQHNVGSVYITYSADDDPNLRGGSWQLAAQGRSIIGVDPEDPDFDDADKSGGAKTHILTEAQIPSHRHFALTEWGTNANMNQDPGTGANYQQVAGPSAGTKSANNAGTSYTGGGQAHNNLHPYETAFVWRRVA